MSIIQTVGHIEKYRKLQPGFAQATEVLVAELKNLAKEKEVYPIISGRAKGLASFAEKIQRKGYRNPLRNMTDLVGARVVLRTKSDVDRMERAVRERYRIVERDSKDAEDEQKLEEFGYLSIHLIVRLENIRYFGDDFHEIQSETVNPSAEIQIRTIAQHAWADLYHGLGYKNEFELPALLRKDFHELAARLRGCDRDFDRIATKVAGLAAPGYEAYMETEELDALIERLETYLSVESKHLESIERLLRARKSKGDHEGVIALYEQHREDLQESSPASLRDTGVAYCKHNDKDSEEFKRGQRLLLRAIELDDSDVDAHASLGGTWRTAGDLSRARACYRQAYARDPTYPYALGNYILLILRDDPRSEVIDNFRGSLRSAIRRCHEQIDVKINLPWAYFDLGLFKMLLGEPEAAISAYRFGKGLASEEWMLGTAKRALEDGKDVGLEGYDEIIKLLG